MLEHGHGWHRMSISPGWTSLHLILVEKMQPWAAIEVFPMHTTLCSHSSPTLILPSPRSPQSWLQPEPSSDTI